MEKSVKVSAKYIHKNYMLGKIQQRKKAFWAKYNGEKRKGFGKIHTKKITCWAKYNRERRHFGQNTMEKSV